MESASEVPSPLVTAGQLSMHLHKTVMFAGKVVAVDASSLSVNGGDGSSNVAVVRAVPSQVQIEPGMHVLVRGSVNDNLSISESRNFPTTVLSDNFGTLHWLVCSCPT